MSIVPMIVRHEGGRLRRFLPLLRGREREVRMLTVEQGIHRWLYDEIDNDLRIDGRFHARGHFGQFVTGARIDDLYFMKRVEDRRLIPSCMEHGVWAISPRFQPQYRFFGFFATHNWFVVLIKERRDVLEQENSWHTQIDRSIGLWDELFPGRHPFVPEFLDRFVSNAEKCDDRW